MPVNWGSHSEGGGGEEGGEEERRKEERREGGERLTADSLHYPDTEISRFQVTHIIFQPIRLLDSGHIPI